MFGRFFVELTLFIFVLFTVIKLKKWKSYFLDKNYIIIFLFLFYLTIFVSTFNNIEILSKTTDQNLIIKSLLNFRFIIYIISVWFVFQEVKLNKNFFHFTILIYFLFLLDAYLQFFNGENLLGYTMPSGRISGIFGDEYILGSYIQKIIPIFIILFYLVFKNDFKNQSNYLLLILILSTTIILLSGDRASNILFLFYLVICALFLPFLRKFFLANFLISGLLLSLIFVLGVGKNLATLDQRYKPNSSYNINNIQSINSSPILKYIHKDHFGHYLVVKEMAKDNLYLGKGIKSFRFMCRGKLGNFYSVKGGVCSTHPHNYYLQSIAAGGLIGFFFIFLIFFIISIKILKIFVSLFQKKYYDPLLISSTICIFVYFWPLIPTGNFFSNWISGFNCFALGIFLFINSNLKVGKN